MAKSNGKSTSKEVKKNSIIDEKDFQLNPDMSKGIWITVIVLGIFFTFYILASIKSDYQAPKKSNNNSQETAIQYKEILAGMSFNRSDSEYLVVYYDQSDNENEDTTSINSSVSTYRSSNKLTIYTCDLGNSFNKKYVTEGEVNTNPSSAEELLINGPTLIKFADGKVFEYIRGKDAIESYLKNN